MPIIVFAGQLNYDEDRIDMLWKMMRMIRSFHEEPIVWKLDAEFLDAVAEFLEIKEEPRRMVCCRTFLDTAIDATSRHPHLICQERTYPVIIPTN